MAAKVFKGAGWLEEGAGRSPQIVKMVRGGAGRSQGGAGRSQGGRTKSLKWRGELQGGRSELQGGHPKSSLLYTSHTAAEYTLVVLLPRQIHS